MTREEMTERMSEELSDENGRVFDRIVRNNCVGVAERYADYKVREALDRIETSSSVSEEIYAIREELGGKGER